MLHRSVGAILTTSVLLSAGCNASRSNHVEPAPATTEAPNTAQDLTHDSVRVHALMRPAEEQVESGVLSGHAFKVKIQVGSCAIIGYRGKQGEFTAYTLPEPGILIVHDSRTASTVQETTGLLSTTGNVIFGPPVVVPDNDPSTRHQVDSDVIEGTPKKFAKLVIQDLHLFRGVNNLAMMVTPDNMVAMTVNGLATTTNETDLRRFADSDFTQQVCSLIPSSDGIN